MKKEELDKLYKVYEKSFGKPIHYLSPEFIEFLKSEIEKRTWYEKFCNFSGKLLKINISKEREMGLKEKINFCNLNIEPYSVYSAFILVLLSTILFSLLFSGIYFFIYPNAVIGKLIPYILLISIVGFGFAMYIFTYPTSLAKKIRIQASSELVLAVLYMAIGLKHIPNLESSVVFTAVNLPGPLGRDLRKLLWDLHVGKYVSVEDALYDFSVKWKFENKEFSQAIDLLRTSTLEPVNREKTIDRAVTLILESNMERMKEYARELKNPITVIHALGIMLPVITLILFPIISVFMPDTIKPIFLVVIYDICLPLLVFWLMNNNLEKRPYGFHVTDISKHPEASKSGNFSFRIGKSKIQIPLLPFALIIIALISLPGVLGILNVTTETSLTSRLFYGLSIFWGITIGAVFYTFFSSSKNKKIKKDVEEIETEFGEAMFLLGTVLRSGQPLEVSLEKVNQRVKDQKISELFSRLLYRINRMGTTLREAVFNKDFGIIKYYPSKIIKNSLRILVESTSKGLSVTASTLTAISEYLKGVKNVDEHLKELLEETTSSMKLLSTFLVPLAAGVVVGLGSILIKIMMFIMSIFMGLPELEEVTLPFNFSLEKVMPLEVLLLVVGIYMIEMLISINIFRVQIERGNDWVEMQYAIGTSLLTGGIIFTVVVMLIHFVFGALIPLGVSL